MFRADADQVRNRARAIIGDQTIEDDTVLIALLVDQLAQRSRIGVGLVTPRGEPRVGALEPTTRNGH